MTLLPRNKWLRWLTSAFYAMIAFVLILGGVISALLNSDNGSRFAVTQLIARVNAMPGWQVSYAESDGTLLRGLGFRDLEVVQGNNTFSVERVAASWNLLTRRLDIGTLDITDLQVHWTSAEPPSEPNSSTGFEFTPLPLPVTIAQLSLLQASVQIDEQSFSLDQLRLSGSLAGHRLSLDSFSLLTSQVGIDSTTSIEGDLALTLQDRIPLDVTLDWRYQGDALTGLSSGLSTGLSSGPSDDWRSASGSLELSGNLTDLQIQHQLDSPLAITSSGNVFTGLFSPQSTGLRFSLEHLAPGLIVPVEGLTDTEFADLRLRTSGQPDNIDLLLNTRTATGPLSGLQLSANARLQPQAAQLQLLDFSLLSASGRLDGAGQLDWASGFQGDLTLSLQDETPLIYLSAKPPMNLQDLSGTAELSFRSSDGDFTVSAQVDDLQAILDGYDLAGSGGLQWRAGNLTLEEVQLATVNNRLFVDGQIGESLDLQWQIEAPELDQILVSAEGSLLASGRLGGSTENPVVEASLTGTDLRFSETAPELRLLELALTGSQTDHQLSASAQSDLGDLQVALAGGFVNQGWQAWQGNLNTADINSNYGSWALTDPTALSLSPQAISMENGCWALAAARLCLQISGDPSQTVSATASLRNVSLGLLNANDPQRLAESSAGLAELPALPENVALQGVLDIDVTLEIEAGSGFQAQLLAQSEDAGLTVKATSDEMAVAGDAERPDQFYEFERLMVTGDASDGAWDFSSEVDFIRSDVDDTALSLRGSLRSSVSITPEQTLNGNIQLGFDDLGWLEALVPELDSVDGRMEGEATITGTVQAPRLANADFSLQEGAADIAPLGIRLQDVTFNLNTADSDTLQLQGSAMSGPGRLNVSGTIAQPWAAERELQLTVSGEEFQLINNPDLNLHVSPELDLGASQTLINLRGRLHLPTLDLRLTALPETAVDVSRDTVIVDYPPDRPDLARTIAADQGSFFDIPVVASLTVSLGDNVHFDGFGLSAGLLGELSIQVQENGASRSYGELSVTDGTYTAYNTELQLEQGKLLFFGAFDNPALDIRAVRRVEEITAGVQMNGTLKNISSQLFSTPALPDNDIIAVLITGKPFSQVGQQDSGALLGAVATLGLDRSQGLTNQIRDQLGLDTLAVENTGDINNSMLTIGKYLSPSLFVRYGVGLFDRQSTVTMDYKLTETLSLQAESGDNQSLDINYRIER